MILIDTNILIAAIRAADPSELIPDAVLATIAINNNVELWSRDHHFVLMQHVLPPLFVEPP